MTDILELERRVTALEAAQNDTTQTLRWVVSKLGKMSAVQDEHTLRLERVESRLEKVETRLGRVENEIISLRSDMPAIVAQAMREVLKSQPGGN